MRAILLSSVPLALALAGCSEKIEAQESEIPGAAASGKPDAETPPDDSDIPAEDVKMQNPVGIG